MITDVTPWGESDHLVREAVRSLLCRYGRGYFLDCYRNGREPEALWHDLCKAGYVGAGVPEHLGGAGSSLEAVIAVGEELALAGMPLLSFIMTELCLPVLARNALPETAARLLPPIITGDRRLAFAITEPDAGTNSFAMRTTAIRSGQEYIVSGRKRWISSAGDADDLFLVCAGGEPSRRERRRPITILMVDMRSPGISTEVLSADAGTPERQYDVIFDNVRVPTENLVGAETDGAAALVDRSVRVFLKMLVNLLLERGKAGVHRGDRGDDRRRGGAHRGFHLGGLAHLR